MHATSVLMFFVLAQSAPTGAGPQKKAQAQSLLTEGSALYERGDYAGALDKFTAAYAAYPSPKLLYNIGEASRDLGRPVEALDAFERFLASAPDAAPEATAQARKSVTELQRKLGRLRIDCATAGSEISVDGRRVGMAPMSALVWATSGPHQVTARHPDHTPAVESVSVNSGSIHRVELRLQPLSRARAGSLDVHHPDVDARAGAGQSSPQPGWWLGRKWTWVAAGSALVFGGTAAYFGRSMQSKFDELDRSCGSSSPNRPGCEDRDINTVVSRKNTANTFWGLSAAAAVAAGVLFFVEGRPVAVAPMAGVNTGFVGSVRY